MRRVLTFLTAIVLLLVSLGVGVFTADLPFWRRALQLPLPADGAYLPVAVIGHPDRQPRSVRDPANDAIRRAGGRGVGESRAQRRFARLVSHVPRAASPSSAISSPTTRRSLLPAALVGTPDGGDGHRPRARRRQHRLARQLRSRATCPNGTTKRVAASRSASCSRKPAGWRPAATSRGLLYRSPWRDPAALPALRHLARRAHVVRQRFRIERARLPARARAGRLLQSVARQHAARRGHRRARHRRAITKPMSIRSCGARWVPASPQLQLDRRAGMPAAHCCWRATARDMMRS